MAGEFSAYGAQIGLDFLTGRALAYTATRTTYLALLTAAPTDLTTLATMSEVNTAGYARQPVTWTAATFASPSVTQNSGTITFGPFTAAMSSAATHCALVSTASGTTGDFLMWWVLDYARQAAQNESIQIPAGQLTMSST